MARYGQSVYGAAVYGLDSGVVTPCSEPAYCPSYDRFVLSGSTLGNYIFELNPMRYDPYRRQEPQVYSVVMSTNPTVDVPYEKVSVEMSWDFMPERMWNALLPYARKRRDGSSENIYIWDGGISGLQGQRIRIEDLKAEVRGGVEPVHRYNVSMRIRMATA